MSKPVMLRLSDEDHKRLNEAAHDARVSMAEFLRQGMEIKMAAQSGQVAGREAIMQAARLLTYAAERLADGWQLTRPEDAAAPPAADSPPEDLCSCV